MVFNLLKNLRFIENVIYRSYIIYPSPSNISFFEILDY